jgi:hypothetical protein
MKNIAAVLAASSVFALGAFACATATPQSAGSDVNDMPTASFQGSYTDHAKPAPQLPITGSFQGSYTAQPTPAPQRAVETSFDEAGGNDP